MRYIEYGTQHGHVIILLHGGGFNRWSYREAAMLLRDEYHVILPTLDGHAGSDRHFTTIEDNAREIITYIDEYSGGKVLMIGGLSLGAQVLLEILSQRLDICRFALVESAAVIPSKMTNALIGPAFGSSYGLIKNRRFSKAQFASYHLKDALFEEYYRDSCAITKDDLIAFMKANTAYSLKDAVKSTSAKVSVFAGEKETKEILRSASLIHETIPGSTLTILPALLHGQFSINRPEDYARTVRCILSGREGER